MAESVELEDGTGVAVEANPAAAPSDAELGETLIGGGAAPKACGLKTAGVLAASLAALLALVFGEAGMSEEDRLVARGAACLFIMALWWVSELLPLAVTSLLPMVPPGLMV
jgi:hypothetical protein